MVEYTIDSYSTPSKVTIDIIKITTPEGTKYRTDYFDENTVLSVGSSKLIATEEISITSIDDAISEIRYYISNLDTQKMNEILTYVGYLLWFWAGIRVGQTYELYKSIKEKIKNV